MRALQQRRKSVLSDEVLALARSNSNGGQVTTLHHLVDAVVTKAESLSDFSDAVSEPLRMHMTTYAARPPLTVDRGRKSMSFPPVVWAYPLSYGQIARN